MPVAFKDYYGALGLERNATEPEIKTAFRGKARQYHPDANPDDPTAEEKFKDVNEAYEVLSDPEKRRMYDRFGDDWQRYRDAGVDPDDMSYGRPRGRTVYSNPNAGTSSNEDFEQWFTGNGNGATESSWEWSEGGGFRDGGGRFSDFFNLLFGNDGREARTNTRTSRPTRGNDLEVHAEITLREAYAGTNRKLTIQTPEVCTTCDGSGVARGTMCPTCNGTGQTSRSKTLEVRIPQGVRTGSRVRIAGQGGPGLNGGPNGDVYLLITVIADPRFSQDGRNLRTTANVSLYTALLGGEVVVETITGRVALRIPEGTQNGRVFRLSGKGMPASGKYPAGDLLVTVDVELPTNLTDEEKEKLLELQSMRQ